MISRERVLEELETIAQKYRDERYAYQNNQTKRKLVDAKLRAIKFAKDRIEKISVNS